MTEDWLDKNGRKLGFAWLACCVLGVYLYGVVESGWWHATVVALQMLGILVAILGTLIALILVVAPRD